MIHSDLLTVAEVARRLRCDPATVRRMIARGDLAASRPGGRLLVAERAIAELLEATRVQPTPPAAPAAAPAHRPVPRARPSARGSVRDRVRARRNAA